MNETEETKVEEPRKLTRSRDDRMIAGVCGGLARYFGLHPAVYRIGFVALAFAGGAGILLYLVAALVIPAEGAQESVAEEFLRGHRDSPSVLIGVAVLALLFVFFLSGPGHWDGWGWPFAGPFWFLLLIVVAGIALWQLAQRDRPSTRDETAEPARRRRPSLFGPVVGVLIAGVGLIALLEAAGVDVPLEFAFAGALIFVGAAIAVGAFWRRTAGLAVIGLLLVLVIAAVAAVGATDVHKRTEHPSHLADLDDDYEIGAGRLELDLRDVDVPPGETRVEARVGVGELVVLVPDDVAVFARGEVGLGDGDVLGRHEDGTNVDETVVDAGFDDADRRLVVHGEVGVGDLQIRRD